MSLSETTQKLLRLVEARSGIPVHVAADPDLTRQATFSGFRQHWN